MWFEISMWNKWLSNKMKYVETALKEIICGNRPKMKYIWSMLKQAFKK